MGTKQKIKYKQRFIDDIEGVRWKTIYDHVDLDSVEWDWQSESFKCRIGEHRYSQKWDEFFAGHVERNTQINAHIKNIVEKLPKDDFFAVSWLCMINGLMTFETRRKQLGLNDEDMGWTNKVSNYVAERVGDCVHSMKDGTIPEWVLPEIKDIIE